MPLQIPKRALIVVDVQNDYDGGNLTITHPPFSQSLNAIARAMDAAAANDVKIVVVKMILPEASPVFAAGSDGAELHSQIHGRHHDHYVEKTWPSAFTGTDLAAWLTAHGIDTVTIAGYMTHNCDLSTVIHAFHLGLDVEFLSDATGALPYTNAAGSVSAEEIHRVITVILQAKFAAVLSTDAWIACLAHGAIPVRDNIYASNQRALAAQT